MKNIIFKRAKPLFSIVTAIALLTCTFTVTRAEESVNSLENKTSELKNELSQLNTELERLSAELNSTIEKITSTTAELEQTKIDLANAKADEEHQYQAMKKRIKYIYENGNTSIIEMLFDSGSMPEFLNRAEFISSVNEVDRIRLEQLVEVQNTVAKKEQQLREQQSTLTALQNDLNQKEANLQSKISNTSGELQKYTTQLEEARKRAREAEEALRRQAEASRPSQDNTSSPSPGVTNQPPAAASSSDLELFAALIECEAGSSNYDGMLAVASVVMNRVRHRSYPNTIRGVIYQSGQFSPIRSGKVDKVLKRGIKSSCLQVAQEAVAGRNNVGSCLSFRAAHTGHSGTVIGGNVFF